MRLSPRYCWNRTRRLEIADLLERFTFLCLTQPG
jgi:hypothetical protein